MKIWLARALNLLRETLEPPKYELDELDWKLGLSFDKARLIEHLCAFASFAGGGFLVFGIDPAGEPIGINEDEIEPIIQRLVNLGRDAVENPITLDYAVEKYEAVPLLLVYIHESSVKPVHPRNKPMDVAFIRCGGTTRRASHQEIGNMMLQSRTPRWEELRASSLLAEEELIAALGTEAVLRLLGKTAPSTANEMLRWLEEEKFIVREPTGGGFVTNLGAIAAARQLDQFPDLSRKAVRVIVYGGKDKSRTIREREGNKGYAISIQGLLGYVMAQLPQSEEIQRALRAKKTVYPEIALRELIANALVHQDFSIAGMSPLVEIFSDRIEISNPGGLLPSKRLDRLIGTQAESRNERLARSFRNYGICEERGTGLFKAGIEIELYGLPPMEFKAGSNYFKVTLFAPRAFREMSAQERLDACYQHTVLKYLARDAMTNKSLRERLKMPERQSTMVSSLIRTALTQERIKLLDPENKSKRHAKYIPFWA